MFGFLLMLFLIIFIGVAVVWYFFNEEIRAAQDRDPAAGGSFQIILLYSGLHAIVAYRITHWLWKRKLRFIARLLSQISRFFTGIEIHPGAQVGKGFFIDHGMGVVIGETTIVGDNVTLFQGVTLGGTGKETGKRHPTLKDNIVVGAGAKVLGNITVGSNSYVGANAVVIRDVPDNATVVGIPARLAKQDGQRVDALMDHVHITDPVMQHMRQLIKRVKHLEDKTKDK